MQFIIDAVQTKAIQLPEPLYYFSAHCHGNHITVVMWITWAQPAVNSYAVAMAMGNWV